MGLRFFAFVLNLEQRVLWAKYFNLACKNGFLAAAGGRSWVGSGGWKDETARARFGRPVVLSSSAEDPSGGVAVAPPAGNVSLEGVHGSVKLPGHEAGFWKQWLAFSGPAILVSVGYMDPGNWGTDLQAGAQYKFGLLWVVGMASLMAIFMQVIAARLGVVTGKDLAQCCRDWFPRWTRWPNWLLCEVAIGACDLAEVLGSAVALNLMFHIPLLWAVIITGLDVLLLLGLQRFGMRTIEAVVLLLVATISVCYFIEIFVLPQTQPSFAEMGLALVSPSLGQDGNARIGHRHHRGHGHAPQPLPALGPGPDPPAGEGRTVDSPRDPLQHHRLDGGPDHCLLRQCGHPGAGGDGVFRHREASRCRVARWRDFQRRTATGSAMPT